jgi:hypothetical protein
MFEQESWLMFEPYRWLVESDSTDVIRRWTRAMPRSPNPHGSHELLKAVARPFAPDNAFRFIDRMTVDFVERASTQEQLERLLT